MSTQFGKGWLGQVRSFSERYLRWKKNDLKSMGILLAFPVIFYMLYRPEGAVEKAVIGVSFGIFAGMSETVISYSITFANDIKQKRFRKFRSLPIYPSADIFGRFLSGAAMSFVFFGIMVGISVVDGAKLGIESTLSVPIIFFALVFFFFLCMSVALVVSIIVDEPRYVNGVATIAIVALFTLTGANGVDAGSSMVPREFLNYLPNTLATRLIVKNTVESPEIANLPSNSMGLGLLLGYAVVFAAISVLIARKMVYESDRGE